MDYAKLLGKDVTQEIHALFTEAIDPAQFLANLAKASEPLWRPSPAPVAGIDRIFRYGVHLLGEAVDYQPEEAERLQPPKIVENDLARESSEDEEDITAQSLARDENGSAHDISALPAPRKSLARETEGTSDGVDSGLGLALGLGSDGPKERRESVVSISEDTVELPPLGELDVAARNLLVTRIASVLRLWFGNLWEASKKNNLDAVGIVFDVPGSKGRLTEKHLAELLLRVKWFMDAVLNLPKSHIGYLGSFKELILLIHEILRGLYKAIALERDKPGSMRFLIVKSVLHSFFKVDFSQTLDNINAQTWKSTEQIEQAGASKNDIRLSYETLMQLYVIQGSLASSPVNILLLDKVSLSLDITTIRTTSPNIYTNYFSYKNFEDPEVLSHYSSRIVPVLAANFNYFYGLMDDMQSHTLNHSSFFSWITGHKLSGSGYMSIDTAEQVTSLEKNCKNLSSVKKLKHDPLLEEILRFECTSRLNAVGVIQAEDERALRAPGFLNVTLLIYSLLQNPTFIKVLTTQNEEKLESVSILRLWLCVSSYVLHHQVRLKINTFSARLVLLTLLKLVLKKSGPMEQLKTMTINEFKWKLCHHRSPVVPNDLGGKGEKNILLYIVDVIQIVLRFNLNKKLDLDNCKIALTILYHILLEFEETPVDNIGAYRWVELYRTLIHFVKFVAKNFNEEDLKYVVEEVYLIFDLILGPSYDGIFEISEDSWIMGSHSVKLVKYDLLLTMLQHLQPLVNIYGRFLPKKENTKRTELYLTRLTEEFDLLETRERDLYEVNAKLSKIMLELGTNPEDHKKEKPPLTTVSLGAFNYADTFKYLDRYQDYIDFDKQVEILDMFAVLYDFTWVSRRGKK